MVWTTEIYLGLDHSPETRVTRNRKKNCAHPGPIHNGPLFQVNGSIKDGLLEELEYFLVPDEAWKALVEEFGLTDGHLQDLCHHKTSSVCRSYENQRDQER